MLLEAGMMAGGLAALVAGAELLVRGASRLAAAMGVPPLVAGLTVVAFGTSAPELAVSAKAALSGNAGIALGNVLGSNIFNVLLILGVSALVVPLAVSLEVIRRDVPVMIGISLLAWGLALDGRIGLGDGAVLVCCGLAYVWFLVAGVRQAPGPEQGAAARAAPGPGGRLRDLGLIVVGLALLVFGARWLVSGARALALGLGVSEMVVGLTVVAAGTSLPELATSVVAGVRGERDIAVGNVIGSNIFNLLFVLGLAGVLAPDGVEVAGQALRLDLPVMAGTAVACLPVFLTGSLVSRAEGVLFTGTYVLYVSVLVLQAMGSPLFRLETAAAWVLLPGAGLVLFVSVLRSAVGLARLVEPLSWALDGALLAVAAKARKIAVLLTGGTVLLVGVAMIVLPGPAVVVIPLGLAILATEFLWARQLLSGVREQLRRAARALRGPGRS